MKRCFYCSSDTHVTSDCHDKGRSTKSKTAASLVPGHNRSAVDLYRRIEEMLDSGEFDWAEDTLTGIQETVAKCGYVTERQTTAVDNIAAARGW